jgi:hypothetical protein
LLAAIDAPYDPRCARNPARDGGLVASRNPFGIALFLALLPACAATRTPVATPAAPAPAQVASTPAPEQTGGSTRPTDALEKGGRVSLSAFALAGRVAWNGTRSVARAARGLVTDGTAGAKRGWEAGTAWTQEVARREAAKVKAEAQANGAPSSP